MFANGIHISAHDVIGLFVADLLFAALVGLLPLLLGLTLDAARLGVRSYLLCLLLGTLSPLLAVYTVLTACPMIIAHKHSTAQRQILGLSVILAITLFVGMLGMFAFYGPMRIISWLVSQGLSNAIPLPEWYLLLHKPTWTPPTGAFGPVWTLLYLLMAVAAWLVWRVKGFLAAQVALGLYALQLALNLLWSLLFFTEHRLLAASVEVVVLGLLILTTVFAFWRISRTAAVLMLPYLAWVAYAAALTIAVWRMNG